MAFTIGAALLSAGNLANSIIGGNKADKNAKEANAIAREQLALQRQITQWNMEQAALTRPYMQQGYESVLDRATPTYDLAKTTATNTDARGMDAVNRNLGTISNINDFINMMKAHANDPNYLGRLDNSEAARAAINAQLDARNTTNDRLALENRANAQDVANLNENEQRLLQQYLKGRQANIDDLVMADRNRTLADTGQLRSDLIAAESRLGQRVAPKTYTDADIQRESEIRGQEARFAVDRAANVASSANEAGLIRNGIDASSTGADSRATIAARLAPLYQQAYTNSRNDALNYIKGLQGVETTSMANDNAYRNATLNEIISNALAPLTAEKGLATSGQQLGIGAVQKGTVAQTGINTNYVTPLNTDPTTWAGLYNQGTNATNSNILGGYNASSSASGLINNLLSNMTSGENGSIQNMTQVLSALNALAANAGTGSRVTPNDPSSSVSFSNAANTTAANANSAIGTALGSFATKNGEKIGSGLDSLFGRLFGSGNGGSGGSGVSSPTITSATPALGFE
jgi:hypothetical protein